MKFNCSEISMTKTPKNGSTSSTPTPTGPASVGTAASNAPPSVGSTKSEGSEATQPDQAVAIDNRSGTPASLPSVSDKDGNTPAGPGPGGQPGSVGDPELNGSELCDNTAQDNTNSVPNSSEQISEPTDNDNKSVENSVKTEADQIKTENNETNPAATSSNTNVPDLPADAADLFDGFDTKEGVKDEAGNDTSDNLAALTDFKEEDLKPFDDACNEFSNGKLIKILVKTLKVNKLLVFSLTIFQIIVYILFTQPHIHDFHIPNCPFQNYCFISVNLGNS